MIEYFHSKKLVIVLMHINFKKILFFFLFLLNFFLLIENLQLIVNMIKFFFPIFFLMNFLFY